MGLQYRRLESLVEQATWDDSTQLWTAHINLIYFDVVKAKSKLVMLKLKTHKMKREGKNGENRRKKENKEREDSTMKERLSKERERGQNKERQKERREKGKKRKKNKN